MKDDHSLKSGRARTLAFLTCVATLAGCVADRNPVAPPSSVNRAAEVSQSPQQETIDEEYARVSTTTVPGFAGYYMRSDTTIIRIVQPEQADAARSYVAGKRRLRAGSLGPTSIEPASYSFAELHGWATKLEGLVGRDGVYVLDTDETTNKLWFGVASPATLDRIRAAAVAAGIPAEVITGDVQRAPVPRLAATTLQDWTDSLRGGFQIQNSFGSCTLGFNALRNGQQIFVSASHCSGQQFALDNATIYQNTVTFANAIGTELTDRSLYTCVAGVSGCRLSDASYFSYSTARTVNQGYIQRVNGGCYGRRCNIDVDNQNATSWFPVVEKVSNNGDFPVSTALSINKVGRTSGWTYGRITRACVTLGNLRCQYVTDTWSEPGDSGSPMFKLASDFVGARLIGILWGGPDGVWTTTYFSPISGVEADLGTISVCASGSC
jgi:hypothetical protein